MAMPLPAALNERFSCWSPRPGPDDAAVLGGASGHECTVMELASRGFTLGALLEFLCMLLEGEVMPSFDPDVSTSFQVTYEAVLPLSAGGPFSRVMTCSERCYPECLITHTWSSLFCHTVAAAVADALGVPFFFHLQHRLRTLRQVRALMDQLAATPRVRTRCGRSSGNALQKTYWLCCVSIDQHSVACNRFRLCDAGHVLNRVSGDGTHAPCASAECQGATSDGCRFQCRLCGVSLCQGCASLAQQVCSCTKPKLVAGTVPCEVDKFDEMMAYLREVHGGTFYHVVALDRNCGALGRTWVVAEIAQGQRLRLRQDIKVLFPLSLAAGDLAARVLQVNVMACQSTNPADTEMILAKIEDKDAFNESLRRKLKSSIAPGIATSIAVIAIPLLAVVAAIMMVPLTLILIWQNGPTAATNPALFFPLFVYILLLTASHLKYGAIVDAVCASKGFRMAVLLDMLEASGLHRGRRFSPLWALQSWYAGQIVLQDTPDVDADAAPPRGQAPMPRTSLCRACLDMLLLATLRSIPVLLLGFSIVHISLFEDYWHIPLYFCYCAPIALFFSDPGVRGRTWQGLALFMLILANVAYALVFVLIGQQDLLFVYTWVFSIPLPFLGCCPRHGWGGARKPRAHSAEPQHHVAVLGRPTAVRTTIEV